jgi:phosphoglycerate-specific signal transduction histidine kinase
MTNKQQEGTAEKAFKNFGKKMDQFLAELHDAGEKLNKEFEQKYQELKQAAEKLKNEANDKQRWKEVEASLKKAGEELENALKTAFGKKKSDQ